MKNENEKMECLSFQVLKDIELNMVNGGNEFSDAITRGLAYYSYKVNKWVHQYDEYFTDTLSIY